MNLSVNVQGSSGCQFFLREALSRLRLTERKIGLQEVFRLAATETQGRTIWIVDAHRDDGKRFVVRADEKLTAFLELESATRACGELL
jgi:hypothetical protein